MCVLSQLNMRKEERKGGREEEREGRKGGRGGGRKEKKEGRK